VRKPSSKDNLSVVDQHFQMEETGEIELALDLYTEDIVWEAPARGISLDGKDAVAENYRKMFDSMADRKVTSLERFATPDRVIDDSIASFRLVGDGLVNVPLPIGSEVESRLIHIFEMRDGKIALETVYEMWRDATADSRFAVAGRAVTAIRPAELTPERIIRLGLGFWESKTLLSAVELGVFTELAKGALGGETLAQRLGLNRRGFRDFFDALAALGMLVRRGDVYANTPETGLMLDRNKSTYIGGLLEMANGKLYQSWGSLTEALRTGHPQCGAKNGDNPFDVMYSDPKSLREFLRAMTGLSAGIARAIARKFAWNKYRTFVDIGTAQGAAPVQIALAHPHLQGAGYDLPVVGPIFEEYVKSFGLSDRLRFQAGDFFTDPLPEADVLLMGHILHDWDLDQKKMLIRKAYEALPQDGALVVFEGLIDDRREKAFGLLMSLNMLVQTPGGFDYTGADCCAWMMEAGFRTTRVEHLVGPDSMILAFK
jgi:ketosteroid isomerase-like protein